MAFLPKEECSPEPPLTGWLQSYLYQSCRNLGCKYATRNEKITAQPLGANWSGLFTAGGMFPSPSLPVADHRWRKTDTFWWPVGLPPRAPCSVDLPCPREVGLHNGVKARWQERNRFPPPPRARDRENISISAQQLGRVTTPTPAKRDRGQELCLESRVKGYPKEAETTPEMQ